MVMIVEYTQLNKLFRGFSGHCTILIVFSTTFRPTCLPAFYRCLSNSETYTELRTTSFIESTGVAFSDSVSHNRVQVLSISVLLLACSQDWTCNHLMIVSLEALGTSACNRYTMGPAGFNKRCNSKFRVGSRVQQTPEEGRRTYRPNRCRK